MDGGPGPRDAGLPRVVPADAPGSGCGALPRGAPGDGPGPLRAGQPRDALVAEVRRQLDHVAADDAVVVACSGGPDSTALAFLVAEARPDLALTLVHVSHGWRDDAADAALVTQHASWLGCDVVHRRADAPADIPMTAPASATTPTAAGAPTPTVATAPNATTAPTGAGTPTATSADGAEGTGGTGGPEAAARALRYRVLREEAGERRAATILVGHSADDQAETVLLRLARGTGPTGLAGMTVVSGDLTRPLLRLRRADLRRFVTLEGLPVADDPTNADPAVRRVRVRQEVVPALARLGPDPVAALVRLADLQRDDLDALDLAAAAAEREAVRWFGDLAVLERSVLATVPRAVASRVVRSVLARWVHPVPDAATVAAVLTSAPDRAVTVPGGVTVSADARWLTCHQGRAPEATASPPTQRLQLPGATPWQAAGLVVHARTPAADVADGPRSPGDPAGAGQLGLDLEAAGATGVAPTWRPARVRVDPSLVPPGGDVERLGMLLPAVTRLEVRTAEPGDRIATASGVRRIARLYAAAHVPRTLRQRWPVVTVDGVPVWVPGLAADESLRRDGSVAPAVALHLGVLSGRD